MIQSFATRDLTKYSLVLEVGKTTNHDSMSVFIFSAHFDYVSRMLHLLPCPRNFARPYTTPPENLCSSFCDAT